MSLPEVIAQGAPSAATETLLYDCPQQSMADIYSVVICNRGAAQDTVRVSLSHLGAATVNIEVELFATPFGGALNLKDTLLLQGSGSTSDCAKYETSKSFAAKTLIRLRATSDTNNVKVSGSFDLFLVAN